MKILYYMFFFILGTVMGSFYHVVASRFSMPNGSLFNPKRSYCPNCKHSLKWYELIPIISYLFQLGKCRHCHKPISIMYIFIEFATGILFLLSYHSFGISLELIIALTLVSFLSIVIVSDLNYLIIPDEVTLTVSIILILVNFFLYGLGSSLLKLGSGVTLFILMYLLMKLGNFLFKAESLGGGDIKLMFVVGLVVNPLIGLVVIFLSSFIALPVSVVLYYLNKEKVIPFGPFIIVSLVLVYFMKIDLNTIYNFLQTLLIIKY